MCIHPQAFNTTASTLGRGYESKRERVSRYIPWIKPLIGALNSIIPEKGTGASPYLAYVTASNGFNRFAIKNRGGKLKNRVIHTLVVLALAITTIANIAQTTIPQVFANPDTYYARTTQADNLTDTSNDKRLQGSTTIGSSTNTQTLSSTNPTMYIVTDNLNKRWSNDTVINDTNTTGDRRNVSIATDSTGNTVAVWEDSRNTDSSQNKFSLTSGGMVHGRYGYAAAGLLDGRAIVLGGYSDTIGNYESTAELYDPVTNNFSLVSGTGGALGTIRYSPQAVVLNDGRVLIAGGRSATNTVVSSAEIFDPNSNTFSATRAMSTSRTEFTLIKLNNGKILAAGGCTTFVSGSCSASSSSSELYDPGTNTWTTTGNLTNYGNSAYWRSEWLKCGRFDNIYF